MMKTKLCQLAVFALLVGLTLGAHGDRVRLQDISALTLHHVKMTNARRSAPVPQLKCVGGTAAGKFTPKVVQCQNRGFDGYDVQWECKTDMDNAYRFGQVEVTCEGYDYPDDPYILRGSCGLEYTIDYTKEGYEQRQQQQHHQYYDDDYHDRSNSYYNSYSYKKSSSGLGSLFALGVAAFVIYIIYKTCLSSSTPAPDAAGPNPDDPPPYSYQDPHHGNHAPPPGFKPEFTSGHSGSSYAGGFSNQRYYNTGSTNTGYTDSTNTTGTGGGFWSGMAAGGLLGYLFGNNNQGYNNYYGPTYTRHRPYGSSWGSGWFGGNSGSSGWFGGSGRSSSYRPSGGSFFSGSSGSSSTGTRTASGFGGTKRR